jgi:hypothetical protein
MMKYRILHSDNDWLPKEGGGIKLWQEDEEGRPLWPHRELVAIKALPMKNFDEIVKGIFGFINYWEKLSNEHSTGEYYWCYKHLCYYWCVVKDALVLLV